MVHRILPLAIAAVVVAGCGVGGGPKVSSRVMTQASAAGAHAAGTAALAAFERMPSLGRRKAPTPIRIEPILEPQPGTPDSIVKIQAFAAAGLTEAETKDNWRARWGCTDGAIQKIDAVKLANNGLNNVPAKLGLWAARGYGYMGMRPTEENRFKVQAVTLTYLAKTGDEALLAKGAPIFTMSADMLEVTTGWDQGFRVGISVLTTLKENYKDRQISKTCQAILDRSVKADSKEEAYTTMVDGLRELARKVR